MSQVIETILQVVEHLKYNIMSMINSVFFLSKLTVWLVFYQFKFTLYMYIYIMYRMGCVVFWHMHLCPDQRHQGYGSLYNHCGLFGQGLCQILLSEPWQFSYKYALCWPAMSRVAEYNAFQVICIKTHI